MSRGVFVLRLRPMALIAALVMCITGGHGEQVAFDLVPSRSLVTVQGGVNMFNLFGFNWLIREQGIDSLVTPCEGRIVAELSPSALRFAGGSRIVPWESESWEPGPLGAEGSAPASYGMRAGGALSSLTLLMKAATRHWCLDLISPELALTNGGFQSRQIRLPFHEHTHSVLDYYFYLRNDPGDPDLVGEIGMSAGRLQVTPVITTLAGRHIMTGVITNRNNAGTDGFARITVEDGLRVLTIPIDARHGFAITNRTDQFRFDLFFTGQWVGIEVPPPIQLLPAIHPGAPLRLVWPPGHTLQRTTRLSPPDWADLSADSPKEIMPERSAEFFRAIRRSHKEYPSVGRPL